MIHLKTLSDRLNHVLSSLQMSQTDLARKIGVKQQVIQYLCSKNVKTSKFSFDISEALGISPLWLQEGIGDMQLSTNNGTEQKSTSSVPLISWNVIPQWLESSVTPDHHEKIVSTVPISTKAFAIKMIDNSMSPLFGLNDILVFDPCTKPKDANFVLFLIADPSGILFRQYCVTPSGDCLTALNQKLYCDITLTDNDKHLGTLIEQRTIFIEQPNKQNKKTFCE